MINYKISILGGPISNVIAQPQTKEDQLKVVIAFKR